VKLAIQANGWTELEAIIKQKVASSLEKTGKNVVERVVKEHIDSDVYRAYTPKEYEATFELRDSVFTKSAQIKNNDIEVVVKHNTDEIQAHSPNQHYSVVDGYSPKDVSDWIPYIVSEGKTANIWGSDSDAAYLHPRPYMDNARDELEQSKEHVDDLVKNLRAAGLDAKKV
jgi:hypothetical protein